MATFGYARVSTLDQSPGLQTAALSAAGCERTWVDHASGASMARPQYQDLLTHLRRGDVLVVWRLDRLSRSVRDLSSLLADFRTRGVELRSVTEGFDTTTPQGNLTVHLLGSFAEFEREIIRERVLAGLQTARLHGRRGGRKPTMTQAKLAAIREMHDARQFPVTAIAQAIGMSKRSVYRYLSQPR